MWTISPRLAHDALAGSGKAIVDVATTRPNAVTDANEDWWVHTPLFDTVDVVGGSVSPSFNLPPAQQPPGSSAD